MITTKSRTLLGGIALVLAALLAVGLIGTASATVVSSETVEITDNETQEIVVDVELTDDPAANNATVELYDDTSTLVDSANLSGSSGDWVTERFNVSTNGNYTVDVVADNATAIGSTEVLVESTAAGVFGSLSTSNQWLLFGGLGVAVVAGVYFWREYDDY